jgi:hypothetical protein
MTLEATEAECAAVAVAPRVSLSDIENAISGEYTYRANTILENEGKIYGFPAFKEHTGPLSVLTVCFLVLKNGFTVIGKSAPASPENFDEALGRKLAREDAIRQLWPLMGFALRDKLASCLPDGSRLLSPEGKGGTIQGGRLAPDSE